jgi:effector-binding domain-containing protein
MTTIRASSDSPGIGTGLRPGLILFTYVTGIAAMIEPPSIVTLTGQPAAVIRLTIPRHEISNAMGPAIGELIACLAGQGMMPAGPVYAHHFRLDPDVFDFEVGVPVAGNFEPEGRVLAASTPSGKAVMTTLHGPYDGLPEGWGEFHQRILSAGMPLAGNFWEIYAQGPESGTPPDQWRTELYMALES